MHRVHPFIALMVAATLAICATDGWANGPATSIAILPGYFAPDSFETERDKIGGISLAFAAEVHLKPRIAVGLMVQYGQFATDEVSEPLRWEGPVYYYRGATGNTWLVAPTVRMTLLEGPIRPSVSLGFGWVHMTIGPETSHTWNWPDDPWFTNGARREDVLAFVGYAGLDLGPRSHSYAVVLGVGGAFAGSHTSSESPASSFWTAQLGLRLRFGGSG